MNERPTSLLMVEDDPEIGRLVANFLTREGFDITVVPDGRSLDEAMRRLAPDLVILDWMLPGEDGLSLCRRLRAEGSVPILMLSAKSEEIDRVLGLEMGADDYLVKPFGNRELLARIRALLRRATERPAARAGNRFAFENFILDLDTRMLEMVEPGEAAPALTSAEFELLSCFVQRPRRVLSRDQILDWTQGRSTEPFDRTVDMAISRLRKKLLAVNANAGLITTVRNGGYLFTAQVRKVG